MTLAPIAPAQVFPPRPPCPDGRTSPAQAWGGLICEALAPPIRLLARGSFPALTVCGQLSAPGIGSVVASVRGQQMKLWPGLAAGHALRCFGVPEWFTPVECHATMGCPIANLRTAADDTRTTWAPSGILEFRQYRTARTARTTFSFYLKKRGEGGSDGGVKVGSREKVVRAVRSSGD